MVKWKLLHASTYDTQHTGTVHGLIRLQSHWTVPLEAGSFGVLVFHKTDFLSQNFLIMIRHKFGVNKRESIRVGWLIESKSYLWLLKKLKK